MKKIVCLITVLALTLCLIACGGEDFTIKFDALGGSSVEDIVINSDDLSTFKLPAAPQKEGYEFKGWYTDKEYTNKFETVKGSVTLYAKWEEITYTVEYEVNGGNELADDTVSLLNVATFTPKTPQKENATFLGWFEDKDLTKPFTTLTKDVTLYAKWDVAAVQTSYEIQNVQKLNATYKSDIENDTLDATLTTTLQLDSTQFTSYKELNAVLKIELAHTLENVEQFTTVVALKDGKLYFTVPSMLLGETASQDINGYIDIEKVIEKVKTLIPESDEPNSSLTDMIPADLMVKITSVIEAFNATLDKYGFNSEEFKQEINEIISKLKINSTDKEFVLTDESLKSFLTSIANLAASKAEDLVNAIYEIKDFVENQDVVDENGNTFVKGQNGYTDAEGNFVSYKTDTDQFYGVVMGDYYAAYYTGDIFKISQDYKCVKGFSDFYSVLVDFDNSVVLEMDFDGVITEKTLEEAVTAEFSSYTYIQDDICYFYTSDQYAYDMINKVVIDMSLVEKEEMKALIEELPGLLQAEFETFTLNQLKVVNDAEKRELSVDLSFTLTANEVKEDYTFKYQNATSIKEGGFEAIEVDYSSYYDLTATLLIYLDSFMQTE